MIQTYQTIANAFTVMDLAEPILVEATSTEALRDVWERLSEEAHQSWFCIVRDNKQIVGYLAYDDNCFTNNHIDQSMIVGKFVTPITPDILIPASTPILDLLPLFDEHFYYFVLLKNNITHAISFVDLDKPPMKLCLFSLFMELESAITNVFASDGNTLSQRLRLLSRARLKLARNLCKRKYGIETPDRLLLSLSFSDKLAIIGSDAALLKLFPFHTKKKFEQFMDTLEKMRNRVAHGESILNTKLSPHEFNSFISKLNQVISKWNSVEI